jgi:Tfp pilus assembly protein PilN
MAAQKQIKSEINLLPQKGFAASTSGRVLLWILSTFRVIVIVTEIIVMMAFLSRFWLDAQNTDLSEEIQQKQAVLASYTNFEREWKDTQKRLKIFSTLTLNEEIAADTINLIASYLPSDIFLTSVSIVSNETTVEGVSPSERGIQQFLVNLQSAEALSQVELSNIETDKDSGFLKFKFNAQL